MPKYGNNIFQSIYSKGKWKKAPNGKSNNAKKWNKYPSITSIPP